MLEFPPVSIAITRWNIKIPQATLDDLKHPLRNMRYPEKETVGDTSQGSQLANFSLCARASTIFRATRKEAA
jgi:hypothetical protein